MPVPRQLDGCLFSSRFVKGCKKPPEARARAGDDGDPKQVQRNGGAEHDLPPLPTDSKAAARARCGARQVLAPAAAQIVPEVFVGLALPPLHDRAEQPPPERSLATRGEERGRRCLPCHGGPLVSRLPPAPGEPLAGTGVIGTLRTPRATTRQDGRSWSLAAQGCDRPE